MRLTTRSLSLLVALALAPATARGDEPAGAAPPLSGQDRAPATAAPGSVLPPPPSKNQTTAVNLSPAPPSSLRTAGLVVGGAGLLVGGVSAVVMLRASTKATDARDRGDEQARQDQQTPYYLGLTGTLLGGAALIGGVVMIVVAPSTPTNQGRLWVSPAVASGVSGLMAGGTF